MVCVVSTLLSVLITQFPTAPRNRIGGNDEKSVLPPDRKTRYTIPSVSKFFDAPNSDSRAAKVIGSGPCSNDGDDDERLAEVYEKRMFPSASTDASSI